MAQHLLDIASAAAWCTALLCAVWFIAGLSVSALWRKHRHRRHFCKEHPYWLRKHCPACAQLKKDDEGAYPCSWF